MLFPTHEELLCLDQTGRQLLAARLRDTIIETVSRQGGHLASNLGAVELTIALHTVFDFRTDRIVFDVGHQAYTHKLLTGREKPFAHLREKGGLSGFPHPSESICDAFAAGHASTAVSAALGMALARDAQKGNYHVVSVVGDGAMTGGMFYEAMNMAGHLKTPLIVILNDNEMSIAKNVGALSSHLSTLRQSRGYRHTRDAVKKGLEAIPVLGRPLSAGVEAVKRAIHSLLVGEKFFESLGFAYYGPIDGHNTEKLIRTLRQLQDIQGPVLLHVVTRKGKGFQPAETDPSKYHGVNPACAQKHPAYAESACQTLMEMAETDSRITALTAAMPGGTGLEPFQFRFPNRFYDAGIAEEHMITMAAGMASVGLRPFVGIYSTFLQRGYDQLLHDVCLQNLPVTFLIDRAGLCGADGATHQGVFDLSFLQQMPNMHIASPRDAAELCALIRLSDQICAPFAIRYPKDAPDASRRDIPMIIPGTWEVLREGNHGAILAVGRTTETAMAIAEHLAQDGISLRVVNARFIKPMDEAELARLEGMPVITMEENISRGGFGSIVAQRLSTPPLILGVPDRFIGHGTISQQLQECGLDPESAISSVKLFINRE